jgi:hypothetical protein
MIGKILFLVACFIFMDGLLYTILGCFLANGTLKGEKTGNNTINVNSGTRWLFRIISVCFTYILGYLVL